MVSIPESQSSRLLKLSALMDDDPGASERWAATMHHLAEPTAAQAAAINRQRWGVLWEPVRDDIPGAAGTRRDLVEVRPVINRKIRKEQGYPRR